MLILFLSGIFDSPKVKQPAQTEVNNNTQGSGVDLSSMQEIQTYTDPIE